MERDLSKEDYPITPAIRTLREKNIPFIPHLFKYEEKGGTRQTAEELNIPEHQVIKTLVMEADTGEILIVLMHGDMEVSTKELARFLKVKIVVPCDAKKALNTTGYMFGGTSPFGTKKQLPVYAEESIFELSKIYINGGKRGFILEMEPLHILEILNVTLVKVGIIK
jgi:Cys-tRNA(Pro) deacylase